jgi:DNA invertase Pin-like site-specific DNA recombinase
VKIGVYQRVSTDRQDVAAQAHAINEWLAARNLTPVAEFSDKISGKSDKRPGLDSLKVALAAGTIDTVVVYRLDRLSRKATDAVGLLLEWMKSGVGFYAVDQAILALGVDNPFRLTFAALFSEIAQMEREVIVSRVRSGLAAAKRRGVQLGRPRKLTARRLERALELRRLGRTYAEIGKLLRVDAATVHRACLAHDRRPQ